MKNFNPPSTALMIGFLFLFIGHLSFGQSCPGPDCTAIPDVNFEQKLINLGIDDIQDGYILNSAAEGVAELDVSNSSISDLSGIEAFVNLTTLICYINQLTSLDLNANTALTALFCEENQLATLDVSANTALTIMACGFNQLTALDVSANTALHSLFCSNNQLTTLDVSANSALTELRCETNHLVTLDVSANTALVALFCSSNELVSLDVSANTFLTVLECEDNQLTSLDVRNGNNTNLIFFKATNNPNLECISVDDPVWSTANWTEIDEGVVFDFDCFSTSILDGNFEEKLIQVYPNPATNSVEIMGVEEGELRIFDNIGQVYLQVNFNSSKVDISSLPNGVYFFQIRSKNIVTTKKIIKNSF